MIITNWERIIHKQDILPAVAAYVMYDDKGECLYVGSTIHVRVRLLRHVNQSGVSPVGLFVKRHKQQAATWPIVLVEPKDCGMAAIENIEALLIASLNPIFNMSLNNSIRTKPLTEFDRQYYLVCGESSSLYLSI